MKCRMKLILFLLLFSVFLLPWSTLLSPLPMYLRNIPQNLYTLTDPPIDIDGNAPLATAASSGNGFSWDPYIIQDKIINASGLGIDGIRIGNTTAYFILRNCTVTNVDLSYSGIMLANVTHARLEINIVNHNFNGIILDFCYNNTLIGNTANDNDASGISLASSDNNTLIGNTANTDYYGISLDSSHNNTLTGNTANYNTDDGIYLHFSHSNTLTGNTPYYSYWAGIELYFSYNNTLTGNTANHNSIGINLHYSPNNTLTGNTANHNTIGIFLLFSHNNTLTGNTALDDGDGISLSHSNYNTITRNRVYGNLNYIVENTCTGNIIENNECITPIPEFTWILVLLGFVSLSLFVMAKKRKKKLQNFSL